eukprot:1205695-Pleurochrysis_carterae.AAC.1
MAMGQTAACSQVTSHRSQRVRTATAHMPRRLWVVLLRSTQQVGANWGEALALTKEIVFKLQV